MNAYEFAQAFLAYERDARVFEEPGDGPELWDAIRHEVFTRLYTTVSGLPDAIPELTPGAGGLRRRLGRARRGLYRQRLHAKLATAPRDILAVRAPRQMVAGQLSDVAIDPLTALFPGRCRVIDTLPKRYHLPDFIPRGHSHGLPDTLARTVAGIANAVGVSGDTGWLAAKAGLRLAAYRFDRAAYGRLLDRARPKLVLLIQNGPEKALFRAARDRGIPTFEAQHGLIGLSHGLYSYPEGAGCTNAGTFPDAFLTLSDYWKTACHYPAGRMVTVGNDFFVPPAEPVPTGLDAVMVVSANIYQADLSRWTRAVAKRLPKRRFLFKMHPNQVGAQAAIAAAFDDLPNVEVIGGETPPAQVLPLVSHLVLVQSTLLFEALQAGRRACILPIYQYQLHAPLFDHPGVAVTPDTETLAQALCQPADRGTGTDRFFAPLDADTTRATFEAAMAGGASWG